MVNKKVSKWYRVFSLAFFGFLTAGYIEAASFDCAKAATDIEKEICSSKELSELDDRLANSYQQARSTAVEDKSSLVREEQIAWVKTRNKSCNQPSNLNECLTEQYDLRLIELAVYSGGFATPVTLALIKGSQYQVCNAVLRYFEKENSLELMRSRDPFVNGGDELVMPYWKLEDNLAVGFKIMMQSISLNPKTVSDWRKSIDFYEQLLTKNMQTRSTEFNINNSGGLEKVVATSTFRGGFFYQHNRAVTNRINLDHEFLNEHGGGFNSISGSLFTYDGRGFAGMKFRDSFIVAELFDSPVREGSGLYVKDEVCVININ